MYCMQYARGSVRIVRHARNVRSVRNICKAGNTM